MVVMSEDLEHRLKRAMKRVNLTVADLNRATGISYQGIKKVFDGKTKTMTMTTADTLARALDCSKLWLATGDGDPGFGSPAPAPLAGGDQLQEVAAPAAQLRRVPVVGTAKMGDDGFYDEISEIPGSGDGHIEIATADPNAYGLRCRGMSMFPAIRDGWYVIVEPNRAPALGEYILIKLRDGRKMVKELLIERPGSFEVMSVNEAVRFTVDKADLEAVQAVGPIVPPSAWRPD